MQSSIRVRQINIKGLPVEIAEWIRNESDRRRCPLNDVIADAVRAARGDAPHRATQFPLFGSPATPAVDARRFAFSFVDLFAGIGGFRIALESLGGECVFTSEWDRNAQRTYGAWFGEVPKGDINEIDLEEIPDHDVLAAGFPCQPFSIAGVSKKRALGQPDGFRCKRQGNLFFRVCDIVREKRPPILLLENVKNLKSHDGGRTWSVIRGELEAMRYRLHHEVIDAQRFVPQHRERIFLVCFDLDVFERGERPFAFPSAPQSPRSRLPDLLEAQPGAKYTLTDHLWRYLQSYAEKHRLKGNGFGFGLIDPTSNPDAVTRTLSARYYKDGSEILIHQGDGKNPRRLTPLECARLMGFESKVRSMDDIVVSDMQAYRQFGNAVVPHVVRSVAEQALVVLDDLRFRARRRRALKGLLRLGNSARVATLAS